MFICLMILVVLIREFVYKMKLWEKKLLFCWGLWLKERGKWDVVSEYRMFLYVLKF